MILDQAILVDGEIADLRGRATSLRKAAAALELEAGGQIAIGDLVAAASSPATPAAPPAPTCGYTWNHTGTGHPCTLEPGHKGHHFNARDHIKFGRKEATAPASSPATSTSSPPDLTATSAELLSGPTVAERARVRHRTARGLVTCLGCDTDHEPEALVTGVDRRTGNGARLCAACWREEAAAMRVGPTHWRSRLRATEPTCNPRAGGEVVDDPRLVDCPTCLSIGLGVGDGMRKGSAWWWCEGCHKVRQRVLFVMVIDKTARRIARCSDCAKNGDQVDGPPLVDDVAHSAAAAGERIDSAKPRATP